MPRFKDSMGREIEVSEEHANQVIRRQGRWIEIPDAPVEAPVKVAKKKSSKKKKKNVSKV